MNVARTCFGLLFLSMLCLILNSCHYFLPFIFSSEHSSWGREYWGCAAVPLGRWLFDRYAGSVLGSIYFREFLFFGIALFKFLHHILSHLWIHILHLILKWIISLSSTVYTHPLLSGYDRCHSSSTNITIGISAAISLSFLSFRFGFHNPSITSTASSYNAKPNDITDNILSYKFLYGKTDHPQFM